MKKIFVFLGTRPEAIKMIPVYQALKADPENFEVKLISTGQHKEMVYQILSFFNISLDLDLQLMKANQSLADLNARALTEIDELLKKETPDWVLVQGDTTTAFSAALAAFYNHISVGHIEAGLRTYDIYSPFPEEANRKFISCITKHHFASTKKNLMALSNEGITENVTVTGNTVIDTLLMCVEKIRVKEALKNQLVSSIEAAGYLVGQRDFMLITGHRRESFGEGFKNICLALKRLAQRYPNLDLVYPVHLNPNVKEVVYRELGQISNIHLVSPLNYGEFIFLMQHCKLILTDSGGIQEEAPTLKKPVFVMREKTERVEAIQKKLALLVGTQANHIFTVLSREIDNHFKSFDLSQTNPYGEGNAARTIREVLINTQ